MKIQCDVCNEDEASMFCSADEAVLCSRCDHQIHSANKLAEKHRRFSLLNPTSTSQHAPVPPLCDICQEKRGCLFCKEDRAILCMDCDFPIHNANGHTMRHSRFLLTGTRVSSVPITSIESEPVSADPSINNCCSSSSSISEYLTNFLPGWHVEDFLIDNATTTPSIDDSYKIEGLPNWVPNPSTPQYLDKGNTNASNVNVDIQVMKSINCTRRKQQGNAEIMCMVPEFRNKRHRI